MDDFPFWYRAYLEKCAFAAEKGAPCPPVEEILKEAYEAGKQNVLHGPHSGGAGVDHCPLEHPQLFECICHSDEHSLVFSYIRFEDPSEREVYATVFLDSPQSFWKRLWIGAKYLFGWKSRYGHFYGWTLRDDQLEQLIKLLQLYRADLKNFPRLVPPGHEALAGLQPSPDPEGGRPDGNLPPHKSDQELNRETAKHPAEPPDIDDPCEGDPGKCTECGAPWEVVRPGKDQPTCDCHLKCRKCGGKMTYHHNPSRWPNVSGEYCDLCGPMDEIEGKPNFPMDLSHVSLKADSASIAAIAMVPPSFARVNRFVPLAFHDDGKEAVLTIAIAYAGPASVSWMSVRDELCKALISRYYNDAVEERRLRAQGAHDTQDDPESAVRSRCYRVEVKLAKEEQVLALLKEAYPT